MRDPHSLSRWVELDYFRRPSGLLRQRSLLTWLAVLAGGLVLGAAVFPAVRSIHQAGPLCPAHRVLANNCEQCHQEFLRPAKRLVEMDFTLRSVNDSACRHCHEGPIHQEQQAFSPACATCHREHRGQGRLTHVADNHCTACHANLPAAMTDPSRCQTPNVTSFAGDHPEFGLWRQETVKDPGGLNFNHQAHLRPEGIPNRGRENVKLACSSCHVPDTERRYFQPVRYADHCASCHPLSVQVAAESKDAKLDRALAAFAREPAPHDRPAVVRAAVWERLVRFAVDNPEVLRSTSPAPDREIPGRPPLLPVPPGARAWVEHQSAQAERLLFDLGGGCRFCHQAKAPRAAGALPDYLPTRVPDRWFRASHFRHESHHVLRCAECHGDVAASRSASDVLLPRIATCRECHTPRAGARSDCFECHRYHDRSRGRGQEGLRSIAEITGQKSEVGGAAP